MNRLSHSAAGTRPLRGEDRGPAKSKDIERGLAMEAEKRLPIHEDVDGKLGGTDAKRSAHFSFERWFDFAGGRRQQSCGAVRMLAEVPDQGGEEHFHLAQ